MEDWDYVGTIIGVVGLEGSLLLDPQSGLSLVASPPFSVKVGYNLNHSQPRTLLTWMPGNSTVRITIDGVITPEQAANYVDQAVFWDAAQLENNEGKYKVGDLLNCEVYDEGHSYVGFLSDVWIMPANDVWVVQTDEGQSIPFPVIDGVILHVDIGLKRVTVSIPDGLMDIAFTASNPERPR